MPAIYTGPRNFNLISDKSFNLVNDVVLSIEFSLSGNPNTQAGLSFFLSTSGDIVGGGAGIGLAYTGTVLASGGITNAVAGFGLDTQGYFALSGGDIDGVDINDAIPNSVTARAGYSENFAMSAFNNATNELPFSLYTTSIQFRSLRYRIGNLGRTMYLDYRANHDDDYIAVAEVDLGDRVNIDQAYQVGIGYASPFSTVEEAVPNLNITSIHIEGLEF